jgi:hypothetical protein
MSGVQYPAGEVHGVRRRRCVSTAFEFVLRQTPRMALGPTLQGLKRAAEAKKCQRIAGRLAALGGASRARTGQYGPAMQVPPPRGPHGSVRVSSVAYQ